MPGARFLAADGPDAPTSFREALYSERKPKQDRREILTKLDVDEAACCSTHCFRRGDATELLNLGAKMADIAKTAAWHPRPFVPIYNPIQMENPT